MANRLYAKGAEKILSGSIDLTSDTIRVAAMKNTHVQDLANHEFYSDISADVVGTPQSLSGKSVTGGKFDADDPTFTAIGGSGEVIEGLAIYKWTGVAATSPLIGYVDTATGLPFTTSGGNFTPRWSNGSYKIFSLVP